MKLSVYSFHIEFHQSVGSGFVLKQESSLNPGRRDIVTFKLHGTLPGIDGLHGVFTQSCKPEHLNYLLTA